MANTAPTPKAVALVLVPALMLMLPFAFFYVGAFHDPTPHRVPVAIVGSPVAAVKLSRLPGDPLDARHVSSRSDALSQIDDREVYGAYETDTNRLFVASAANRATAIALGQTTRQRPLQSGGMSTGWVTPPNRTLRVEAYTRPFAAAPARRGRPDRRGSDEEDPDLRERDKQEPSLTTTTQEES